MNAIFSDCRTWRYVLTRDVNPEGKGTCCFVMLNPSTANETKNDPTILKCIAFVRAWGYRYLVVVNLFGLRSPHPDLLEAADDPVGPDNHEHLHRVAHDADLVVCAWGKGGALRARGARVKRELLERGVRLYCLRLNPDGTPMHPLARGKGFIPLDAQPQPWGHVPAEPGDWRAGPPGEHS